jgi:hypothetical protein
MKNVLKRIRHFLAMTWKVTISEVSGGIFYPNY